MSWTNVTVFSAYRLKNSVDCAKLSPGGNKSAPKKGKTAMNMIPAVRNLELIEGIEPKLRYNGDTPFSEWQAVARKKLCELLGMDNIERDKRCGYTLEYMKEKDGYTEYRFLVESEENYCFPVVMRVPSGKEGKLPTILCLQGHSNGFHISLGVPIYSDDAITISGGDRDFSVRAVKEGFIAVAIEQRNFGECGGGGEKGPQCHVSSMAALLHGRTTIGERVHDVSTTIDVMLREFDFIDEKNIMLMGNSGGGTATYYAACLDERISLAMPSCAVCTYKHSIAAMEHCVCNFIPNIANYFDMGDLAGLIAPRALVIVNGKKDPIFPEEGVIECFEIAKKLYDAAGVPERLALVTGPEGHRFYADAAWPVLHKISGI